MKKIISLSLGLLILAGLPGCGGDKPVTVTEPEPEETHQDKNIKQARTSGTHPKEVGGWEEADYC